MVTNFCILHPSTALSSIVGELYVSSKFVSWGLGGRRVGANSSWPHLLPNISLLYLNCFFNIIIIIIIICSLFSPVTAHLCSNICFLFLSLNGKNVTGLNICIQE